MSKICAPNLKLVIATLNLEVIYLILLFVGLITTLPNKNSTTKVHSIFNIMIRSVANNYIQSTMKRSSLRGKLSVPRADCKI